MAVGSAPCMPVSVSLLVVTEVHCTGVFREDDH